MKLFTPVYSFLRWCPGGLGLLLRQKVYPLIIASCGRKVLFGRFVNISNPGKIHLADGVIISDNVTLDAGCSLENGPSIILGESVFIGAGCCLHSKNKKIIILSNSSIGSFCKLEAKGAITISEDVLLAAFCRIGFNSIHLKTPLKDKSAAKLLNNDINIESGCWLGVRCLISPGASVGKDTIVGAHSNVQTPLTAKIIAVGTPAKKMRSRFNNNIKTNNV